MRREEFGEVSTSCPIYSGRLSELKKVVSSQLSVFIHGESGTGKELVARAVHESSGRRGAFIAINCAALSPSMIVDELFGHVRGAFTGADRDHAGALLESSGGTLFLDEVGDAPMAVQVALLRALESQKVKAVGAAAERAVDLRVVAATSRDMGKMIEDGEFRPDLFYRLAGFELSVPALRERVCDIPDLAHELAEKAGHRGDFTQGAVARMKKATWPGNVRQLKHAVLRAVASTAADEPLDVVVPVERGQREGKDFSGRAVESSLFAAIAPADRARAHTWQESGMLLFPSSLSRRAERTLERHLLFYLLLKDGFDALPAAIAKRVGRLFCRSWSTAEGGSNLRALCRSLSLPSQEREVMAVVEGLVRAGG